MFSYIGRLTNGIIVVYLLGIKRVSGTDGNTEYLLQVSNSVKDIRICMLSDDKFSEVITLYLLDATFRT